MVPGARVGPSLLPASLQKIGHDRPEPEDDQNLRVESWSGFEWFPLYLDSSKA